MAQIALAYLGVPKSKLQAVESLLEPNVWRAVASDTTVIPANGAQVGKSSVLKKYLKLVSNAIVGVTTAAKYSWTDIAKCKLKSGDIGALSVGAGSAAEGVAADAAVVTDVASTEALAETVP